MREDSVEIWFPVEKDAGGHPNQGWEQLSAGRQQNADRVMHDLRDLGGLAELTLDRLIAVDAPSEKESSIWDYLKNGQARGDWDLQVGFSPGE
jgi:hypothetical protein